MRLWRKTITASPAPKNSAVPPIACVETGTLVRETTHLRGPSERHSVLIYFRWKDKMNYRDLPSRYSHSAHEKQIFHGLDALRGYAALAVVALHASALLQAPWLLQSGFLAVDLFFAISGFVIAHSYDAKIPTIGVIEFMRLRAIRFFPLLLVGLSLGLFHAALLLALGHQAFSFGDVLIAFGAGLLFLPAPISALSVTPFGNVRIAPLDAPAWSLIYEFWVNTAYALFFPLLSVRVLAAIAAVAAIGLISTTVAFGWEAQIVNVCRVGFSFLIGILLYRCKAHLPNLRWARLALPAILLLAFMVPKSDGYSLFFALTISPLIVAAGSQWIQKPVIGSYLGSISYCIYAIHFPILELLSGAINRIGLASIPMTTIVIVALIVGSKWLDANFDGPIRDFLKRKGRLRRAIDVREGKPETTRLRS